MAYLKDAVEAVAALQSPIEREIYGAKAAGAAGISPDSMRQEVERFRKNRLRQAQKKQTRRDLTPAVQMQPKARELRYDNLRSGPAEAGAVQLLLLDPGLFPTAEGRLRPESFSSPVLGKIYAALLRRRREGAGTQLAALAGELTGEEMSYLTGVMDRPADLSRGQQAMEDYIQIIETEALKRSGGPDNDPLLAAREKFREKKRWRMTT